MSFYKCPLTGFPADLFWRGAPPRLKSVAPRLDCPAEKREKKKKKKKKAKTKREKKVKKKKRSGLSICLAGLRTNLPVHIYLYSWVADEFIFCCAQCAVCLQCVLCIENHRTAVTAHTWSWVRGLCLAHDVLLLVVQTVGSIFPSDSQRDENLRKRFPSPDSPNYHPDVKSLNARSWLWQAKMM